MICEADTFTFVLPPRVAGARRILIKPAASCPIPYPVTTSREVLAAIVAGIRRVSEADIVLLENPFVEESAASIYESLGYDFPRIVCMDVRDCDYVEIENPLPKHFAMSTFWIPNIILSSDYLISVVPFRVDSSGGQFSVRNLLGLLPSSKYGEGNLVFQNVLQRWGTDRIAADLYFTIPFDLGIIDARLKLTGEDDALGDVEEYGKVIIDEPFEADRLASEIAGVEMEYMRLIETAKTRVG